jgi:hypothetical protein
MKESLYIASLEQNSGKLVISLGIMEMLELIFHLLVKVSKLWVTVQ